MLFNSYIFIFLFLPLALLGYYGLGKIKAYTASKVFLTCMSLWFYSYFKLDYLWIILSSILWNYGFHRWLAAGSVRVRRELVLGLGIVGNVCLLFYFKYFDFLLSTLKQLGCQDISLMGIVLPLGISFFTFQQIGFLVDTYRGQLGPQSLVDYGLFVTFFPQLIAGPIVSGREMLPQIQNCHQRKCTASDFYLGACIFIAGLFKKVVLADTFGKAVDWGFTYDTVLDGFNTAIIFFLYAIQLYLDFSGYCDMARGLGKLFQIELPLNFNSPYKARNIIDFWDRWHMSLSNFFVSYVYIPLGGNRKGFLRTCLHVMLVFLISGFWHGANWTFVIWGCAHGILSVLTRIYQRFIHRRWPAVLAIAGNFSLIFLALGMFRAESVSQGIRMLEKIFTFQGHRVFLEIATAFRTTELHAAFAILGLHRGSIADYGSMLIFLCMAVIMIWLCPNIKEIEEKYWPALVQSKWVYAVSLLAAVIGIWSVVSMAEVSRFLYFNF